jgi:hypothetical protein
VTRAAALAIAVLLGPAPRGFGQTPDPAAQPVNVEIELAWSNPPRDVALFTALAEAANRGADLALDKTIGRGEGRGRGQVAGRLARVWLVNLPIAALASAASHNAGHFARASEFGGRHRFLHVTQWPWPVPIMGTIEGSDADLRDPFAALAVVGGGEQGSDVLRGRLLDKIYSGDRADYFDWILLGYAAMDFPLYAWTDLRPSTFASQEAFMSRNPADFRHYVFSEAVIEGRNLDLRTLDRYARSIRRSAWLNLADFSLWNAIARTARYVITGERTTANPAIRLGSIGVVPGAYATLGSIGLERGVDVRLISRSCLTHVNLRAMSVPARGSRWGAGIEIRSRSQDTLRPTIQVDAWQRLEGEAGFRLGTGLRRRLGRGAQPFETGFTIGYKSEGYLNDAPYRAGLLGSLSTTVRF